MEKLALPVVVVLGILGYHLIGEQFKMIRANRQELPQVVAKQIVPTLPEFKPVPAVQFQPFNPFTPRTPDAEPAADDYSPVAFESADGFYRAAFPGRKPTTATFSILPNTPKITRHQVPKPETVFEIDDYDSGWNAAGRPGTAKAWLKKCHQSQLDGMHAREEAAQDVTVHSVPGIAFEALYSKDDKVRAWYGKVYLVGSRLVTVSVYGDPNVVNQRAYPFLGKFELTHKGLDAAHARPTD